MLRRKLLALLLTAVALVQASLQAQAPPAGAGLVVVAGASGQTGRHIIAAALEAGYAVRGLTSDLARARTELGPELYDRAEWRAVDVREAAAVRNAVRGAHYVISAIGARVFEGPQSPEFIDYGGNVNLIEAALATNARRYIMISSAAAGPHRDHRQAPMLGYVRLWKTRAEQRLRDSGLAYTIIGPAGLLDTPAGRDGLRVLRREDYVSTNVSRGDVARVAIDALGNPDAIGKSFALVGDRPGDPQAWRVELRALPRDGERSAAVPAREEPRLEQLAWLAGHWASSGESGGWSEELWLAPQSTLMPGLSREVRENGRTSFEYLRIEQRPDGRIVYIASPSGREPTEFPLQSLQGQRAVFANPAHDFPQRLTYWREGSTLRAELEGREDGRRRVVDYRWTLRREP
jgi:uncharacterized protein YbjT (DUF2867 family)